MIHHLTISLEKLSSPKQVTTYFVKETKKKKSYGSSIAFNIL
jgi:hypothetical protein